MAEDIETKDTIESGAGEIAGPDGAYHKELNRIHLHDLGYYLFACLRRSCPLKTEARMGLLPAATVNMPALPERSWDRLKEDIKEGED